MVATSEHTNGENSTKTTGLSKQIIASVIVSIASCQAGMFGGWLSPMTLKLLKEDSPVETMTKDEIAFMGSLPSYAGVFLAFLMAYIAKKFGRKPPVIIAGFLSCVAGAIITFAPKKEYLYVGRFLGCIITTAISSTAMYISETVHESIRGTMLSLGSMLLNGGILVSYTLGSLLSFKAYNAIFIFLPLTYTTLLLFWIPESPHFLVEKSRLEDAKKSLLWFRAGNHLLMEIELDKINATSGNEEDRPGLRQIFTTKSIILALIISIAGYGFQTASGVQAILNYAGLIFEEAGSLMSPDTCSIITGSILTIACFLNFLLIDRLGRKPLLYISFIGGAISLLVLSVFLYVKQKGADVDGYGWIPIGSLGVFMTVYGVGVATVPGAIANEISPTSVRPIVNASVIVVVLPLVSLVVLSFPYLDDNWGLYSVFAIPVVCNVAATFFTFFIVPETKGKAFVEIEEELRNW